MPNYRRKTCIILPALWRRLIWGENQGCQMGRVLPFIVVSLALVVTAMMQAQSGQEDLTAKQLAPVKEIEVELLDPADAP